jgi:hypothetical protein
LGVSLLELACSGKSGEMGKGESREEIAASTWPDFWEIASAWAQNFLRMLGAIGIDLFAPNDLSLCFFSVRPSDQ